MTHLPLDYLAYLDDLANEFRSRLSTIRGSMPSYYTSYKVPTFKLIYEVARNHAPSEEQAEQLAEETASNLLRSYRHRLVSFECAEFAGTSLDLLDLGGEVVFVIVDDYEDDTVWTVAAELPRDDDGAVRAFVRPEVAFRTFEAETVGTVPTGITFQSPMTEEDIRSVIGGPLAKDETHEHIEDFMERETGCAWPTETQAERTAFADTYLDAILPSNGLPKANAQEFDTDRRDPHWAVDPELVERISQLLGQPPVTISDRGDDPASRPRLQPLMSDIDAARISRARLKAMREDRYFISDPNVEGAAERMKKLLFGGPDDRADGEKLDGSVEDQS